MSVFQVSIFALIALAANGVVESLVTSGNDCTVSINFSNGDLKEPQPLILEHGKNGTTFLYPIDERGTVKVKNGGKMLVACPGRGNYIQGIWNRKNANEIETYCVGGKIFGSGSDRFDFSSLTCKFLPVHVARRTKNRCYGNAAHVEIGFALSNNKFVRTLEICRDDNTMMTHWSKYRLTSRIAAFQSGFKRPGKWQAGDYYGNYNIDEHYKPNNQIDTIAKQVGSKQLAIKYINIRKNLFLARGHLTAKADFVYGSAQSSTFWYMNAAPQWQTFNAGNWNTLESNVRQYAGKTTRDFDVYTGTHGHTSLTDVNGKKVPIYLYVNGTTRAFPVPKFYWKIIHDPVAKRATSFIGLNDPWTERITDDIFICANVADKIKWLTWQWNNIAKGVSYACGVDDLRKSVPHAPRLSVNDILA